jgi:hypothetical protein
LALKIIYALLIITGLVVRGSVSYASVSAYPMKACTVEGAGAGGVRWAFLAAYATYVTLPLHMVGRVLIWQASIGQLAELVIEVGQIILVLLLSYVLGMTISSEGRSLRVSAPSI